MEKLITVVIPAYNAEEYIYNCLDKLTKQDFDNFNIVVVNDGSKDDTQKIAEEFSRKDARVMVITQENSGTAIARINGAKKANGKYIMFLDSDDFYDDGALRKVAETIEKYNTDMVKFRLKKYPSLQVLEPDNVNLMKEVVYKKDEFKDCIYPSFVESYFFYGNCTFAIKKECIEAIDEELLRKLRYAEDMRLSLDLYSNISSIAIIPDALYNYVLNHSSMSNPVSLDKIYRNIKDAQIVYGDLYKYLEKWEINTQENIKKLDVRILLLLSDFYSLVKKNKEYISGNYSKEELYSVFYSDFWSKIIDRVEIKDLPKTSKYYDGAVIIKERKI